jgi:copper oxidase (laccase) domain-containing protein
MDWQRGIDGVILAVQDLYPVILTADCAPVMFWSPGSQVCGIAHIGLVGAINQLAVRMVTLMKQEFGVSPEKMEAAILPSIRGCHYNLSRSGVWQRVKPAVKRLYGEDNPHYADGFFRLPEFIRWQLESAGLVSSHISDLGICTVCRANEFFSHVHAGFTGTQEREGRFGSVIGIGSA